VVINILVVRRNIICAEIQKWRYQKKRLKRLTCIRKQCILVPQKSIVL